MQQPSRRAWIASALLCVLCGGLACVASGCGGGGGGDDKPSPVGPPPSSPYTISGTVKTSGGTAIAGATVTISTTPVEQTTSGSDGSYGFWVGPGGYTLHAEKAGFQPADVPVTLLAGEAKTVDIVLTP